MDETLFLGHLRYATYGKGDVGFCHPFVLWRKSRSTDCWRNSGGSGEAASSPLLIGVIALI